MRPFQQGSLVEGFVLFAVMALLLSGFYVPIHATSTATKTPLAPVASPHSSASSIADTAQKPAHAPFSQAGPTASSLGQAAIKSVRGAIHQTPSAAPSHAPPARPVENVTANSGTENGTSPAGATTTITNTVETQFPNDSSSAGSSFRSHTMTPLVCSMTISASPLGDFVGQKVTFTANGCSLPSGYYWTWGNLPPGCITQNQASLSCTPSGGGQFEAYASIINSAGAENANAHTWITVYSDLAVTSPSTVLDVGMHYNLSVSPTSDSADSMGYFYYYLWSNLPPGCQDNSGTGGGGSTGHPWVDCTTGTSGTYNPTLTVVYSNGVQIASTLPLTISSLPVASVTGPTSKDTGQILTFTTSVDGGSMPFEYQWSDSQGRSLDQDFTNCPSSISAPSGQSPPWTLTPSITCTAGLAQTIYVIVHIRDAAGQGSLTNTKITVYTDPTIYSVQASRTTLDLNQPVWFNATATGGSGVYTYTWTGLPASGCAGTASWSVVCTISQTGPLTPSVMITDSDSMSSPSASLPTVMAYSDPQVASISISRSSADVNQEVWFNATEGGGYGGGKGYTYSWSGLPQGCPTVSTWVVACKIDAIGKFTPTVSVIDGDGYVSSSYTSSAGITFYNDPTVTLPTASPKSIDVTQTTTFSTSAIAPAGNSMLTWTGLPQGCSSSDTPSLACTPTSWTGTAQVVATVTDGNGYAVSSSALSITVSPLPVANIPSPMRNMSGTFEKVTSSDIGQNVTFEAWYLCLPDANCGQGSGGDQYSWSESGVGFGCVIASTQESLNCAPTAAGTYAVTFTITDSNGGSSKATSKPFNVYLDPDVATPTPSLPSSDTGVSITFQATVTGGSGVFGYVWSGLPSGCATTNLSTIACTPNLPMKANVSVTVTDTNGYTAASKPAPFTVNSAPIVSLRVNRSQLDANEAMLFYANASGGTGSYNYAYSGLPTGCITSNTARLTCTPIASGTFVVTVWVNDTGGGKANSSISFIVYPDPKITTYWFWEGGQVAYANETLSIMLNFTGGITPYDLCFDSPPAWVTCASGQGGTNFSFAYYHYGKAGTYPVIANITDSTGWRSTIRFNETIYYPILVSAPSVGSVHQGVSTNATFSIYNLHGAPPLTWWLNDSTSATSLCGPVTASSYGAQQCAFVPAWNGTDKLNLTVADSLHTRLFVTFSYTVTPDLGSLALSAQAGSYSAAQIGTLQDEVGATTTFLASYVGGAGPYTCILTENGTGTITLWSSSTASCTTTYTWTHGGSYTLNLTVKDSLGGTGGSVRAWMVVDVTAPVNVTSVVSTLASLDAQVIDNVSAKLLGGLPAFSFTWDFGNGVTKTTSQPWILYAWPSPGTFTVKVTVTDGTGTSTSMSTQVHVIADPAVKVLSVVDGPISTTGITSGGSTKLPSGTTASFNLTFTGGTGPYSVVWKVNRTTVNTSTVFGLWINLSLPWPSLGNDSLTVTITDSEGQISTFSLTVKVMVDVVGPVTLTITRSVVDTGMWANTTASATGGWAPFAYDWLIASAGGNRWVNGSVDTLNAAWTATGSYSITATVVDAFGYKASETTKLTVNAVPTAPCAPELVSGVPMSGNALTFSLSCVSGGTGPLSYSWSLGGNHQVTSVPQVTVTFHQATTYVISVNVTDALGETAVAKVLTLGTLPPSIDNATYQQLSLSHNTTANGTVYHLELEFVLQTSDTDGAVTGYRYSTNASNLSLLPWIPVSEKVANLTLTGPAIQQLYIQVIDSYNRTSSPYTLALNLSSPPSGKGPTGPSGQGTDWGLTFLLIVVAAVVALVAILAFVEFRKKRRSGGGPTTTTVPSSDSGVAKAITDHLEANPNEEEGALVHQVVAVTGATDATVRTQLSILTASHKVEKTESGGCKRYSNAAGEVPREELVRMGMITDTIRSTTRSETPVTGRRLKEVLTPYNLSEGEIRNFLLDLRGEVSWDPGADFGDFNSVVFRAAPSVPETPRTEVVVDESVIPKFLDDTAPPPLRGKRQGKRFPAP